METPAFSLSSQAAHLAFLFFIFFAVPFLLLVFLFLFYFFGPSILVLETCWGSGIPLSSFVLQPVHRAGTSTVPILPTFSHRHPDPIVYAAACLILH